MTQKEFYQKQFLPAFHRWEVYMKRSGSRAYEESHNICAMKELRREMEKLADDDETASLEFTCNDGDQFIDIFLDYIDNETYYWAVLANGDLREEAFNDFFVGILIQKD